MNTQNSERAVALDVINRLADKLRAKIEALQHQAEEASNAAATAATVAKDYDSAAKHAQRARDLREASYAHRDALAFAERARWDVVTPPLGEPTPAPDAMALIARALVAPADSEALRLGQRAHQLQSAIFGLSLDSASRWENGSRAVGSRLVVGSMGDYTTAQVWPVDPSDLCSALEAQLERVLSALRSALGTGARP